MDWAKNRRGADHGVLYQEKDRQRLPSEVIDYKYHDEHELDPAPMEAAFARPLRAVVSRLELLGFTIDTARDEYLRRVTVWQEEQAAIADPVDSAP